MSDKLPLHLLPYEYLAAPARALLHGQVKYGEREWETSGVTADYLFSALQRHLWAYNDGQEADPESGLCHLDHAAARLAQLLEVVRRERATTADRPNKQPTVREIGVRLARMGNPVGDRLLAHGEQYPGEALDLLRAY